MAIPVLSLPLKVALPCAALGIILFGVSFGVPYWVSYSYHSYSLYAGLWTACGSNGQDTICYSWTSDKVKTLNRSWFHKNQALQCLALIALVVMLGSATVFLLTKMKIANIATVVSCFVSVTFMIIGCIVYATDLKDDDVYSNWGKLDWAFGFNIVAAIFIFVSGVCFVLNLLAIRNNQATQQ